MPSSSSSHRPFLARLFLSPDEPRLRAGWRLLVQTILLLVILGCLSLPVGIISATTHIKFSDQFFMLISELISFFAILISVFLSRRLLDKRSISSLGLDLSVKVVPDLTIGFVISLLSLVLVYVLEISFGWIHIVSFAWQILTPISVISGSTLALITFILVGWNEELLSRGYHLQTLASGLNLPFGVIISSAIFGILHLSNPNATWVSVIGIFLAGIFLTFGYIRTHKLWLSIGLHIGWNFTEGVLLGFPVSGWNGFQLTRIKVNGPIAWTGGAFGPEAGFIILPGLIFGLILIYLYTQPIFRK
jgi:membrane protease YdiL (CAAX protease family)